METKEELKEQVNPDDIIFSEECDEDMPEPETNNYNEATSTKNDEADNKALKPTYKFMELFHSCLGKLPYSAILKNNNEEQIKLIDLIRFVEAKHDSLTVKEMNAIISFVANCPLEYVRPLMEIIGESKRQSELWTIL